ncbi:MAG: hypothetical protein NVSMB44_17300 [Ktedonobacteraceae bacterium]
MSQIYVKTAAILNARAEDIYATIADYQHGHPRIVPPENFSDLQVEQGGYGAGTIIRFKMKVLGVEQAFRQRISEPEPGRVLVEEDIDSMQNIRTTFTVEPVNNAEQTQVEIATTMHASPGLQGLVERIVFLIINPQLYRKELKLLETVARQKEAQTSNVV